MINICDNNNKIENIIFNLMNFLKIFDSLKSQYDKFLGNLNYKNPQKIFNNYLNQIRISLSLSEYLQDNFYFSNFLSLFSNEKNKYNNFNENQ